MNPLPAALSLGSNLGDTRSNLEAALRALNSSGIFEGLKLSSLYLTEPVGCPPQPDFLNMAVAGKTLLSPAELLARCLEVEKSIGRTRDVPKGPRLIDIDILFYGDLVMDSPELTIPHRAIPERNSILAPLAEICPDWRHPLLGLTAAQMAGLSSAKGGVKIIPS